MVPVKSLNQRAEAYAELCELVFLNDLGAGLDGRVIATNQNSAVTCFKYEELYVNERNVYLRIFDNGISEVCGCDVPKLLGFHDEFWVIEMGIVRPPFVLDFAGAYLDQRPEYPSDVYAAWIEEKKEQYKDDWPWGESIMATLAGNGIYLADVKPGNITLH